MLITFHCSKCQSELEADASMSGSEVKCPQCATIQTAPRQSLGPGVTVGGFEIIRMLGEGGMGEVYLAKQLSLNRNVALKILPAQMKMRRGITERFFKEVQLLARLEHANIVMAFEAGEDSGVFYLAMGYVNGESLDQKLRRGGPMKEDEALQMISKLAGALDYAWKEHKLLHRDIKPSNVMLTAGGEIKLMDFGLAKCLADDVSLTVSGAIIGTPNYMSPEQVDGRVEPDCRADLYSLGATLYHMVTGKLPFAGSSIMETLRKQVNEALPDPRTINPAVSENCVTLLEIMLSKNRDQRHPDYTTLMDDIERVRLGRPPLREPLQAGESVLLRAAALGISGAPKPSVHRKAPAKSNRKLIIGAAAVAALVLVIGAALVIGLRTPRQDTAKSKGIEKENTVPPGLLDGTASNQLQVKADKPRPDEALAKLTKQYIEALTFMREHPDDYAGALLLLEPIRKDAAGTELEAKVNDDIGRVGRMRQHALDKAVTSLKEDVHAKVADGNFEGALKRIEMDTGLVTEETRAVRKELAQDVRAKKQAAEEIKTRQAAEAQQQKQSAVAKEKLAALAQGVATDLLKGDATGMIQRLAIAKSDAALESLINEINELNDMALQAAAWPGRVAQTFEDSKGKMVAVEFKGGRKEQLTIISVEDERIKAQKQVEKGSIGRDFTVNDLGAAEKLKRIGDDPRPVMKVMRGLVMVRCANDWTAAEKEFASAPGLLAEALAREAPGRKAQELEMASAKLKEEQRKESEVNRPPATQDIQQQPPPDQRFGRRPMGPREWSARRALHAMVKQAEVMCNLANPQAVADDIRQKEFSSNTVEQIRLALADFDRNFSQTQAVQEFAGILDALRALEPSPILAALKPATEENVRSALEKLEKANGRLRLRYRIQGDGIELELMNNPALRDLKALAGLPITKLNLMNTSVDDLRSLAGRGNAIYYLVIISCPKLADTDRIPEYFPNLKTINIDDNFPHPEILTRCAKLEQVIIGLNGQPLSMEQFKQRFARQFKQPAIK